MLMGFYLLINVMDEQLVMLLLFLRQKLSLKKHLKIINNILVVVILNCLNRLQLKSTR
ncbi:unnamed protein product [Schistosoma mattheei]|uniref:Uncharacterized protein n=1 Tax=Schistosoma mattheei TaxID=31246 RepID=A0A183PXH4_9TREM|nr:unnamed protein product [Schistosoma mattheei]